MTPEDIGRRAESIYREVAALPPEERRAALDRLCSGDSALRDRILLILQARDAAREFPTSLAEVAAADLVARETGAAARRDGGAAHESTSPDDERPGARIGNYRLLQLLGEGGFGVVYLAEQEHPVRRRVALKIIKPGMDSRAVIARFEAERQALALMDHPNIARIFEAGATALGRPYFVMEYVAGVPITDHCDRHRLPIRRRLALFATVCDAVAHAHTKGVIHRDLKPRNILVSQGEGGAATVKIIDFGIAKAMQQPLTEHTIFTEQGVLIGTPEYMSPEQAELTQQDIDTRSDVYSLGVVLYELLTGALPFDSRTLRSRGLAEIRRIIREEAPPRPSTRLAAAGDESAKIAEARGARLDELARELRGELEWIPLKSLRKDRSERYRSALELGDDVRRYLAGEPLLAGPESASYRFRKLVQRNKGPVAAITAVLAALVLGLAGTVWQAHRASERAEAAEKAEGEQRRLAASEATARKDADERRQIADRKTAEAEFEAYVANIAAAESALRVNEIATVRRRLDACPERLRGWEWRYLDAESDQSLLVVTEPAGAILTSRVTTDNVTVVTTTDADHVVWIRDVTAGTNIALRGHKAPVRFAAFDTERARLVTASDDRTARIWDVRTGAELVRLEGHTDAVLVAAFDDQGAHVLTASPDKTARVWDDTTGIELAMLVGLQSWPLVARFSPDGRQVLAALADTTTGIWHSPSGRGTVVLGTPEPGARWINEAEFSPDGTLVVTASDDGSARVWNLTAPDTREAVAVFGGHDAWVEDAAFSPEGQRIVTASRDGTACVWRAADGREIARLRGHLEPVNSAVFSPDGTQICTASSDNTIRIWDASEGRELAALRGHESEVGQARFAANGTRIVSTARRDSWGRRRSLRMWDTHTARGLLLAVRPCGWRCQRQVQLSPDGSVLAAAGALYDTDTGEKTDLTQQGRSIDDDVPIVFSPDGDHVAVGVAAPFRHRPWIGSVHDAAAVRETRSNDPKYDLVSFNRDGTRLVTSSLVDNAAHIWDAAAGNELAELEGHSSRITSASFNPDGTRVLTTSLDATARIWDAATGQQIAVLPAHAAEAYSAAFSPDGTLVLTTAYTDVTRPRESQPPEWFAVVRTARLWDASSGRLVAELRGHADQLQSAQFSPDGTKVVTASVDGTARIWDVATATEAVVLRGHTSWVSSARFSPDGSRIVTASTDKTVRLWDVSTGKEVLVLRALIDDVVLATFSADGARLLAVGSTGMLGTIRLWDSVPWRVRFEQLKQRGLRK